MRNKVTRNIIKIFMIITMMATLLGTMSPALNAATVKVYENPNSNEDKIIYSFDEKDGLDKYGEDLTEQEYRLQARLTEVETPANGQIMKNADYSGSEMSFSNLSGKKSVLCQKHHAPLFDGPSYRNTPSGSTFDDTIMGNTGTDITDTSKLRDGYTVKNQSSADPFSTEGLSLRTKIVTTSRTHEDPDAMKTWVICNIRNTGHPTPEQQAWWAILGQDGAQNEYYRSAQDFSRYISQASTGNKRTDTKFRVNDTDAEGNPITLEYKGYEIKAPEWVKTNPVVSYNMSETSEDQSYYLVGPYAMNYVVEHDGYELPNGNRGDAGNGYDFSFIDSVKIRTNTSEEIDLTEGGDWELIDENGNVCKKIPTAQEFESSNFPKPNKPFYLKIYTRGQFKDAKTIDDFKINFKYLNAQAFYDSLEGEYTEITWSWSTTSYEDPDTHETWYTHKLVANKDGNLEAQKLTTDAHGMWWMENYELSRKTNIRSVQVHVVKKVVDDEGHVIPNNERIKDRFDFVLKVKGNGMQCSDLNVPVVDAGNGVKQYTEEFFITTGQETQAEAEYTSANYFWLYDDVAQTEDPTFSLREVANGNKYKIINMTTDMPGATYENGTLSGTIKESGTIDADAVNQLVGAMQGYLRIKKQIVKPSYTLTQAEIDKLQSKEFTFKVKIKSADTSKLLYNGEFKSEITGDLKVKVKVNVEKNTDGTPKTDKTGRFYIESIESDYAYFNNEASPIYWFTRNNPRYEVEELPDSEGHTVFASPDDVVNGRYLMTGTLVGTEVEVDGSGTRHPRIIEREEQEGTIITNLTSLVFKNKFKVRHSAPIEVIKRFDITGKTEDEINMMLAKIKEYNFTFGLNIGGNRAAGIEGIPESDIVLKGSSARISDDGKYIEIIGRSEKDFTWIMDAPEYKLYEKNVPEGTKFDKVDPSEDQTGDGNAIYGVLKEKTDTVVSIENFVINTIEEHQGEISIEKILGDIADLESKKILNKLDFYFYLDIKGDFMYKGKRYSYIRIDNDGNAMVLKEDGTPVNEADKDKAIIITPEVTIADDGSVTYANNTFGPIQFKWYGTKNDGPSYKLEEDLSRTDLSKLPPEYSGKVELADPVYITSREGKITETTTEPIKLVVKNALKDDRFGKIKIIKEVENLSSYDGDIKDLVFKFDLKVMYTKIGETTPSDTYTVPVTIEPQKKGETYVWEWESDVYTWDSLTYQSPTYTMTEVEIPKVSTFENVWAVIDGKIDESATVDTNTRTISGKIIGNKDESKLTDKEVTVLEVHYKNKVGPTSDNGKLKIVKTISGDKSKLEDKTFKFQVKIRSKEKFTYLGKEYEANKDYYLDSKAGITESDSSRIEIHIAKGSDTNSWESDLFKWHINPNDTDEEKRDKAPTFEVDEKDNGGATTVNWKTNKTGTLANGGTVTVECENSTGGGPETRKLKFIKTFDGVLTDELKERLKNLTFQIEVTVDGYSSPIIVTLVKDSSSWKWVGETGDITVLQNEDGTLKDTIARFKEINIPEGVKFKGFSRDSVNLKNESATATIDIEVHQEVDDVYKGNLDIVKKVLNDELKGREFKFKVEISGTFTYKGHQYTPGNPFKEEVTVKEGEDKVEFTDIEWDKNSPAPTYTINEIVPEDADYELDSISGNSSGSLVGKLVKSSDSVANDKTVTVEVTATNKLAKGKSGYFKFVKVVEPGPGFSGYTVKTDDVFNFEVTVNYRDKSGNVIRSEVVARPSLKQDEIYVSPKIEWPVTEGKPTFDVFEINVPSGYSKVSAIMGAEVTEAERPEDVPTSEVKAVINEAEGHKGKFKVKKEIIAEEKLLDPENMPEFKFEYDIKGNNYFYFGSNPNPLTQKHGEFKLTYTGTGDKYSTFEIEEDIIWFGDDIPTVEVKEKTPSKGWFNHDPNGFRRDLKENDTIEITFTNELPSLEKLLLTIDMGGIVWEDSLKEENKNDPTAANGMYDDGEKKIKNVEVYIYDGSTQADLEDTTGKKITQPFYTDENGNWSVNGISLPEIVSKKYHVEYVYDGQTYQPTKFLSTGTNDGMSNQAKSTAYTTTQNKKPYFNSSLAIDKNREEVDSRIAKIYGKSAIDGSGITIGEVEDSTGTNKSDVIYKSKIGDLNGASKTDVSSLKSYLQTQDANGHTYPLYKATASTYYGGAELRFPTDKTVTLASFSRVFTENGIETTYVYTQTKDYLSHINLGLVKRPQAGTMAVKNLESANVVVRDNLLCYTFKSLADLKPKNGVIHREIDPSVGGVINEEEGSANYYDGQNKLPLYKSDYFYREELYKSSKDYEAIKDQVAGTEMDVYLNYVITIANESPYYKTRINAVNDYFDSTLELVNAKYTVGNYKADHSRDMKKMYNNAGVDKTSEMSDNTVIARGSYYKYGLPSSDTSDGTQKDWVVTERNLQGSDGKSYDKMTLDFGNSGVDLDPVGLSLNDTMQLKLYVTLKVKKEITQVVEDGVVRSVVDAIATGNKSNIVEIANYSTFYKGTNTIAGKIDEDSAADNINIKNYNERFWYEDDTYAAPVLEITVKDANGNKNVFGKAWEDNSKVESDLGAYAEADEAVIGGLTTELVEKVEVKDGGKVKVYDVVWPTNEPLGSLGGLTIKDLTGFDSVIETSRNKVDTLDDEGNVISTDLAGSYKFTGMASGNYITRYEYGIDKSKLPDVTNVTGNPIALKPDGSLFNKGLNAANGSAYTYTANYYSEIKEATPSVYNGQDYKTTLYHNGAEDVDNDAVDDEARRLEVMAKSTTITNNISEVFAEANISDGYHQELFDNFGMFADTNYLEFSPVLEPKTSDGAEIVESRNIDVGLVERPRNDIVLDKEIKDIKITTNDNKTIFNASYDTDYYVVDSPEGGRDVKVLSKVSRDGDEKVLIARMVLNDSKSINADLMQSLDKSENKITKYRDSDGYDIDDIKNFRFINVDEDILQGATITINYKFTAINIGEKDYTKQDIADLMETGFDPTGKSQSQVLYEKASEAKAEKYEYNVGSEPLKAEDAGKYIGEFYYKKVDDPEGAGLALVTTRIRQLVDYTDNDGVFDTNKNNTEDSSWKNTNATELAGNGMDKNQLLSSKITEVNKLFDKNERTYISEQRNGVALSIDEMNRVEGVSLNNAGFEKQLLPLNLDNLGDNSKIVEDTNGDHTVDETDEAYLSELFLTITRTVGSEDDANDLSFDNIAEVVKSMNAVGRRDIKVVSGNANPKFGEFEVAIEERDSSATELVTFTPPTGINANEELMNQILLATSAALVIIGAGVIIIRRFV